MPPDIRTGLSALAGSGPAVGMTGQGPPGSDPLAALFAALLAQSGGPSSQTVPALPKLRASTRTNALFQDESAPAKQTTTKQTTVKTATETIANTTQTSTPLPILPPSLLPIQMKPSQMRPITPPTAGVTVGQKTMDTLPALAALPQETTSAKPDGELPLQGAVRNASGASAQFPAFLIASPSPIIASPSPIIVSPSLKGSPPALALPTAPVTALPGILGSAVMPAPRAMAAPVPSVAAASSRPTVEPNALRRAVSGVPPVAVSTLSGINANPSALVQPRTPFSGPPRTFALSANAAAQPEMPSALMSALPAAVTQNAAPENNAALPSVSRPAPTAAYQPSSQGLPISTEALLEASPVPALGKASAVSLPSVTLAAPERMLAQTNAALPITAQTIAAQSGAEAAGQPLPTGAPSILVALPSNLPAVAGLMTASSETPQKLAAGASPEPVPAPKPPASAPVRVPVPSAQKALGGMTVSKTFVTDVGTAKDGTFARDGKFATEGVTATEGAREGSMAKDGHVATDGKNAMDSALTMEGAQATEGIPAEAGASRSAPDRSFSPSAGTAIPEPPAAMPEKSLKSAAVSADNNTRIDPAGGPQTTPAKMLPPELTLQVVGKRSERIAASDTSNTATALPSAVTSTPVETAKADAKPLTPVDRAEMVRQVADGVGAMRLPTKPGASEQMTLQLHPKDWGQLQVSVKITPGVQANAAQTVSAHIVAQTPQVKAALESNSGELRLALRASGLHLDKITVTVQSVGASAQAGPTSSGSHHGMSGGAFSQASSDQKTDFQKTDFQKTDFQKTDFTGNSSAGTPSFSAFTGSHGGRQGSQTPQAYATPYQTAEPDGEEGFAAAAPRRLALGQVDIHA